MDRIVLLSILMLASCASNVRHAPSSTVPATPTLTASPTNSESGGIRLVDFRNFTYDWYPTWADVPETGPRIILKDGTMNVPLSVGKEPRRFFLIDDGVKFGDLTGDQIEEAIVVLGIFTSGTSRPGVIFVFGNERGQPKRLWVYETGDRWNHGYHNAYVKDAQLVIERYKPTLVEYQGETHDMSSSSTYVRDYFKWVGGTLHKVRSEETPVAPDDKNPWVSRTQKK